VSEFQSPISNFRFRRTGGARGKWEMENGKWKMAPGFTLLEAVLSLSLTVMLLGGVYTFYHATLAGREDIHQAAGRILAQRRVLEMMTEDLRSGMLLATVQTGLSGTAEGFSIPRAVLPPAPVFLVGAQAGAGDVAPAAEPDLPAPLPPSHDVQLVGYRLYRYEDEDGVEHIGGIERTCQRTIMAAAAEEGADIESVVLTEHVKFLHVSYWDPAGGESGAWVDSWSDPQPPKAVLIRIGSEPLEEGIDPKEYPYRTLWRVMHVPSKSSLLTALGGAGRAARASGEGGEERPE